MKRKYGLGLFLLLLSCVAGYLLSKASLVGKAGMHLFYKQYQFLNIWWQTALLIFGVWLLLAFLQGRLQKNLSGASAKWVQVAAIGLAIIGLYFTYQDFRNTITHRWLGERFHLGGYLFWLGWISISVFYLTDKQTEIVISE